MVARINTPVVHNGHEDEIIEVDNDAAAELSRHPWYDVKSQSRATSRFRKKVFAQQVAIADRTDVLSSCHSASS
jgi:hypothetical protein